MAAPLTEMLPQTQHMSDDHANASDGSEDSPAVSIKIHFRGAAHDINVPSDWTLRELATMVAETYTIPVDKQKYLITPKGGTYKPPFDDLPVSALSDKKIVLLGTPEAELSDLNAAITSAQQALYRRRAARASARAHTPTVSRRVDWKTAAAEAQYTFHAIRPLPYLPNPARSQRFLERLANDPGIKASMLKHQFSVGLLTEMDPAMHTTHESRTLGLNRNRGEVIELRLRTDAYDGYRDYKTIRKTLCHELSHNIWGDHDRNFWNLTKEIEKEVERNDWAHGGHSLGREEFYNPEDGGISDEDFLDEGGWTGGEFVLGGTKRGGEGLSRREILAKAAEERARKAKEAQSEAGEGPSSS